MLEPFGCVWPADGLRPWAAEKEGGLKVLTILCVAQSGLTVLSPQMGLVSCPSHLHAQLIVSNASQNMQMQSASVGCSIT